MLASSWILLVSLVPTLHRPLIDNSSRSPMYFIASYAYRIGISKQGGANLIGINNGISAVGKMILGHLADRYGRLNMVCFCCIFSALGVLTLWMPSASSAQQTSHTTPLFIAFVFIYGLTAGGYVSLFPTVLAELFGMQHFASINGFLYMLRGVGTLVGTPATSALLRGPSGHGALASLAGVDGSLGAGANRRGYVDSIALNGSILMGAALFAVLVRAEVGRERGWKWKA